MKAILPLTALVCALVPGAAHAWGNAGHRIVCQIALERLTPAGQALLNEALAMNADVRNPLASACPGCENSLSDQPPSFQAACMWPDDSRDDTFKGTYEYHYINVPKAETQFSINRDCRAMDCNIVAIQRYARYLAEPAEGSRPRERKALALRYLGHFVGDLHQPLHVGFVEDLGGNRIDVKMPNSSGGTFNSNLHRAWDGQILTRGGITSQAQGTTLNAEITPAEVAAWETFDLKSWAAESYEIARTKGYTHADGSAVVDGETLSAEYLDAAFPISKERLKKAGVRLAFLINSAAAGTLPENMIQFE